VSVLHPLVLVLLGLAVVPLLARGRRASPHPGLAEVPADAVSRLLAAGLATLAVVAIVATVLGLAGIGLSERTVARVGTGADLVLLIDRSSSMDNSFADRAPTGDEESKSAAAKRLLKQFVVRRPNDRVGIAAFSTAPMFVVPLTDRHAAVAAAVDPIDRPGLAYTDVGRGLAMALSMAAEGGDAGRAIVLVSDGAAVIDRKVQEQLRAAFARDPANLYWLFLRSKGAPGINDGPREGVPDTPQALPERHLDRFLKSLGVPYRAFEAESPAAVADAIAEIDKLESRPIGIVERAPRRDLSTLAYAIAAAAVAVLVLAKLAERPFVAAVAGVSAAAPGNGLRSPPAGTTGPDGVPPTRGPRATPPRSATAPRAPHPPVPQRGGRAS